jgi:non-ribosomal peptide synthetase component F
MGFHVVDPQDSVGHIPAGRGVEDLQLLLDNAPRPPKGNNRSDRDSDPFSFQWVLGRSDGTHARFVTSPFTHDPEDRIYLTGDFGYYRHDGAVVSTGKQNCHPQFRGCPPNCAIP